GAGCFRSADAGFCTLTCPSETDVCDAGQICARGLNFSSVDGNDHGLCLPICAQASDCAGAGALTACSGPMPNLDPNFYPARPSACFASCFSDADCNSFSSGLLCNTLLHRCADPASFVGRSCASASDCRDLGPGGSCMVDGAGSYCTLEC